MRWGVWGQVVSLQKYVKAFDLDTPGTRPYWAVKEELVTAVRKHWVNYKGETMNTSSEVYIVFALLSKTNGSCENVHFTVFLSPTLRDGVSP